MKNNSSRQSRAFDLAVNAIGEFIILNKLKPGDSLLPEPELAAQLGISRNVVREAIRHYRTLGIIEAKQKAGTAILSLFPQNPYAGYFPFLAAQENIYPRLLELRICLEFGSIPLLIKYVKDETVKQLYGYCDQIKTAECFADLAKIDCNFHSLLLEQTENPFLMGLLPLTVRFFSNHQGNYLTDENRSMPVKQLIEKDYTYHLAIVDALQNRDTEALQQAFIRHYSSYKL